MSKNNIGKTAQGKTDKRTIEILNFLQDGEKQFGDIAKHLKQKKLSYHDTHGLSRKLNDMIEKKLVRKIETDGYPKYRKLKNQTLDSAIMGDILLKNALPGLLHHDWFHYKEGLPDGFGKLLIHNEKTKKDSDYQIAYIDNLAQRFGFYILSVLTKSLEEQITRGKKFNKEYFLNYSLNLSYLQDELADSFLDNIMPEIKNPDQLKDGKKIIKRLYDIKKHLKKEDSFFYDRVIKQYEFYFNQVPETMTELKKKGYRKNL